MTSDDVRHEAGAFGLLRPVAFRRVLVANRGEIARRVFATCRRLGLSTAAVYAGPDTGAPFVREADVAVALPGEPMAAIASGGGPTHTSPASITARANSALSDRKP